MANRRKSSLVPIPLSSISRSCSILLCDTYFRRYSFPLALPCGEAPYLRWYSFSLALPCGVASYFRLVSFLLALPRGVAPYLR